MGKKKEKLGNKGNKKLAMCEGAKNAYHVLQVFLNNESPKASNLVCCKGGKK